MEAPGLLRDSGHSAPKFGSALAGCFDVRQELIEVRGESEGDRGYH